MPDSSAPIESPVNNPVTPEAAQSPTQALPSAVHIEAPHSTGALAQLEFGAARELLTQSTQVLLEAHDMRALLPLWASQLRPDSPVAQELITGVLSLVQEIHTKNDRSKRLPVDRIKSEMGWLMPGRAKRLRQIQGTIGANITRLHPESSPQATGPNSELTKFFETNGATDLAQALKNGKSTLELVQQTIGSPDSEIGKKLWNEIKAPHAPASPGTHPLEQITAIPGLNRRTIQAMQENMRSMLYDQSTSWKTKLQDALRPLLNSNNVMIAMFIFQAFTSLAQEGAGGRQSQGGGMHG